ncbi:MAG: hypothetical protein ACI9P5_004357 [Saprospiraceae bacterium]|jgi:hypothetical protein|tara:strand:- start:249 stop:860 length:612 start_codon:yes stop_codon:yes gene_type:complete
MGNGQTNYKYITQEILMSYLWSGKITDYYYSNPESNTVAVLWTDPEDGLTREHYIKIDETDEQWKDFIKEVPYEKIDERTRAKHEVHREQFRIAFREYSQKYPDEVEIVKPFEDIIIEFLAGFDKEDSSKKEQLFKLKHKVLEQEIVKNSKSSDKFKNAKTFIRKANTPIEVLLGYMVFTDEAKLKMAVGEKFEVLGVYVPIK